jgi:hypothetical protein
MEPRDDVPKCFFPSPCPGAEGGAGGLLVGWRTGLTAVVAGVVPAPDASSRSALAAAAARLETDPAYESLRSYCGALPSVLGRWEGDGSRPAAAREGATEREPLLVMGWASPSPPSPATPSTTSSVAMAAAASNDAPPRLPAVLGGAPSAPPAASASAAAGAHVVLYSPPAPLRLEHLASRLPTRTPPLYALGAAALALRPVVTAKGKDDDFEKILAQMNAASFVHATLTRLAAELPASPSPSTTSSGGDASPVTPTSRRSGGGSGSGGGGGGSLCGRFLRAATFPLLLVLLAVRVVAGVVLAGLAARIPASVPLIGGSSIYDHSTLARQLHFKLRDFCRWPLLLRRVQRLRADVRSGAAWHAPEALVRDTAWLFDSTARFAVDTLLGIALALALSHLPWAVHFVLTTIHTVGQVLHIDVLRTWIDWLMGLPAGLKLNHFAGRKLGGAVLGVIEAWEGITTVLTPFEPAIVVGVGFFGLGGASLLLAMASDILELVTLHLYTLYTQFAWLHNQQVRLISSLWRLFRGKKSNILRGRVDSNDYDVAQLLLGTLLFTVVFFLFPTTLVYYAFFSSVWLCILLVRACLWGLITLLNNLSLFTALSTALAPRTVPSGVHLSLLRAEGRILERITTSRALLAHHTPGSLVYDAGWDDAVEGDGEEEERGPGKREGAPAPLARLSHCWFQLHSQSAPVGIVLSPFAEALSIVSQRYSAGVVLRTVLYGDRGGMGAAGGPHRKPAPSPTAPPSIPAGAAATAKAAGAGAGAGAGSSAPGGAGGAGGKGEGGKASSAAAGTAAPVGLGTWREYYGAMNEVAERWCGLAGE